MILFLNRAFIHLYAHVVYNLVADDVTILLLDLVAVEKVVKSSCSIFENIKNKDMKERIWDSGFFEILTHKNSNRK